MSTKTEPAFILRTSSIVVGFGTAAPGISMVPMTRSLEVPSSRLWFEADQVGRDVFSRTLLSARIDLLICVLDVLPALLIGTSVDLVSGYHGGWFDAGLMRIYDIAVVFPFFVLILAIVSGLGLELANYFIALALVGWVSHARLVRAEVLVINNADCTCAAKILSTAAMAD